MHALTCPRTFTVRTLGCRVNQYETRAVAEALTRSGWTETGHGEAGVALVNVCAVTGKGSRKARRLVAHLCREAPWRRVYIMGCATPADRAAFLAHAPVRAVVPPVRRDAMVRLLTGGAAACPLTTFRARTRAYVKVQEGCDRFCSYCIVPLLRGRSRSRSAAEIRGEVERLVVGGVPEVWLVGTNLGDWTPGGLPALLEALAPVFAAGRGRVRLGSLGAECLTDALAEVFTSFPWVCRHVHLSLQSGAPRIRRLMGRRTPPAVVAERAGALRARCPGLTFSADVIVGFPSESDAEFAATCALIEGLEVVKLHVFPFSRRPGTRAAAMEGVPGDAVIAARTARLAALERVGLQTQARTLQGGVLEVVVEKAGPPAEGVAAQYVRVRIGAQGLVPGTRVRVRAQALCGTVLWGEIFEDAPVATPSFSRHGHRTAAQGTPGAARGVCGGEGHGMQAGT